jgi:tetratricopeptide (TPR) repeat protein
VFCRCILICCALELLGLTGYAQNRGETDLEAAARAQPRNPRIQNMYGIALQQQGRLDDSIRQFQAALQLDPKFAGAANNLALALLMSGKPAEALETLEKHPFDSAGYYAIKGNAFNALGRADQAAEALRRATRLAPGKDGYLYDLAVVLLRAERSEEAESLLVKARTRFPRSAKIHAASGMLAYLKGRNSEAAREYETATRIEPSAADLWSALGDVYSATDNLAGAEKAYSRAVALDPGSAEYRVKAGKNLMKLQRPAEAAAAFESAVKIEPRDAEAHFQLGKAAAARGDDRTAITHYEKALESQPALDAVWYQLSLSYRRSGQEAKSREALERFRKSQ